MNDLDILKGEFNFKTHADNFINYLEVVIREDGTVEYAVPSHQQKLEAIAREIYGDEKFEQMLDTPESNNYLQWLCNITHCCSVWNDFFVRPQDFNFEQLATINKLANTYYTRASSMPLYQGEY